MQESKTFCASYFKDFNGFGQNLAYCWDFGMVIDMTKLYNLIPEWMTLTFTQGHRVLRNVELVQSFCGKVLWSLQRLIFWGCLQRNPVCPVWIASAFALCIVYWCLINLIVFLDCHASVYCRFYLKFFCSTFYFDCQGLTKEHQKAQNYISELEERLKVYRWAVFLLEEIMKDKCECVVLYMNVSMSSEPTSQVFWVIIVMSLKGVNLHLSKNLLGWLCSPICPRTWHLCSVWITCNTGKPHSAKGQLSYKFDRVEITSIFSLFVDCKC